MEQVVAFYLFEFISFEVCVTLINFDLFVRKLVGVTSIALQTYEKLISLYSTHPHTARIEGKVMTSE